MKIANIEKENLHVLWTTWEISIKLSEKMWLIIILNVTKKAALHPLFRKYIFRKTRGSVNWPPFPFSLFRVKNTREISREIFKSITRICSNLRVYNSKCGMCKNQKQLMEVFFKKKVFFEISEKNTGKHRC